MSISLSTGHTLTSFQATDAATCVALLKEQEIHRGLSLMPNPYRLEDFERWTKIVQEDTERIGKPLQFAIREPSGSLIGGIGATGLVPKHKCEIGYWLGKPFWGQGIMSAAVEAMCGYLWEEFQLVRISALVFDGNAGSMRVLEKCGFQLEGCLRKHYLKRGRYIDGYLYAQVR